MLKKLIKNREDRVINNIIDFIDYLLKTLTPAIILFLNFYGIFLLNYKLYYFFGSSDIYLFFSMVFIGIYGSISIIVIGELSKKMFTYLGK